MQGGEEVWTEDVLNLGVLPDMLIRSAAKRFENEGGVVLDSTSASGAAVHPNGVALDVSGGNESSSEASESKRNVVSSKILLDCMGHASPIVRQSRCGACTKVHQHCEVCHGHVPSAM